MQQTGDLRRNVSVLRRQADRLNRILEISQVLTRTYDLNELLQLILSAAIELTDTETASIMLLNEAGTELRFAASTGNGSHKLASLKVPVEGSLAGSILAAGKPMVIQDVQSDPRHFRGVDTQLDFESRSLLGVPLMIRDKPIGVLEALNKSGDESFTEEDGQVLMTLAAQAAVAIENAQLVTALQKAYERLNEVDQIKSDFIAIASHELRTPLGLILGYAAMLKDEANPEMAEQLEVVVQSALRLRGLIDDMVNLQHVAEGKAPLELTRFDLAEMLEAGVQSVRELYTAKEQAIRIEAPERPIAINADRSKLALAFSNLLTNAIKYTPPHGRIVVSFEVAGDEAQVHVADTGVGIPAENLERIFERFYQVEPHLTRKHGGLGLGLAIAKGMVTLHGGRIWCESVEGYGSRFTFAIPLEVRTPPKETGQLWIPNL